MKYKPGDKVRLVSDGVEKLHWDYTVEEKIENRLIDRIATIRMNVDMREIDKESKLFCGDNMRYFLEEIDYGWDEHDFEDIEYIPINNRFEILDIRD